MEIMNNNKKAIKSGIYYTLANFISKGLLLISTPIFARLLTKNEFGDYSNFTSWMTLSLVIVTLNVEASLMSAKYDYSDTYEKYCFSVTLMGSLSTCIWLLIVNLFSDSFTKLMSMKIKYINIMLIYILFLAVINVYQSKEQFFYRYKSSISIGIINTITTTGFSIALVLYATNKMQARIVGQCLPTIIIGIILYILMIKKAKKVDFKCWLYALPICIPYIPHLLSLSILNTSDRIMIQKICGSEYTALYSLAYMCGSIITLLITSMNSAFAPWLGEKLYLKEFKEIKKFSYIYILIFVFITLGVMLLSPEIMIIMGGKKYVDAVKIMPAITMGCLCQFLYTLYVDVEQFNKKIVGMAIASISAAILNYILNLILIPRYGYTAAAYTTLIGYLWLLIVHMFLVKKIADIYNDKFVLLVIIGMLMISFIMINLYKITMLRYLITFVYIIIGIIIMILSKNRIMNIIR